MSVHACTILARNYLPLARVLAGTFAEHHPDGHFTALVVDLPGHGVPELDGELAIEPADPVGEPFEVIGLLDLGADAEELLRMAMLYDVTEFATAVKPWLLEHLLRRGADAVIYLDPDVMVFGSLEWIAELARETGIVLTPHSELPVPRDGKATEESSILAAGIYNLGFIAVGRQAMPETPVPITEAIASGAAQGVVPDPREHPSARELVERALRPPARAAGPCEPEPFLSFWKTRLVRQCVNDPLGMRFVDQRWVDFVPGIYSPAIVRHPGCNVAYWNLAHREVAIAEDGSGRVTVNGEPLVFFHFSGYDPRTPQLLSKHQGDRPRILLSERPALRRLCDAYGERMVQAGFLAGSRPRYGFTHMGNGVRIDDDTRKAYRDAVLLADSGEDVAPPIPWTRGAADELCHWLRGAPRGRIDDPRRLSIYLATVFGRRVDQLRLQFFDPQFANRAEFLAWARAEAAAGRLTPELVPEDDELPVRSDAVAADPRRAQVVWTPGHQLHPGILVAGHMSAELGIGEVARLTARSAQAAGIPVSTYAVANHVSRELHTFEAAEEPATNLDVNVVSLNADNVPAFCHSVGPSFFEGRYSIGQWAWELEEFPDRWRSSFDPFREIWAISTFCRDAIAARTDKPVFAMPPAIVPPEVAAGMDRRALGLPGDRFVFLFVFDMLSVYGRKNPEAVVAAFERAFAGLPGEAPLLVVKVINGTWDLSNLERLKIAAQRAGAAVVDGYFHVTELHALVAACDAYVSLHRSEGFGFTMAEAMSIGKPVIATGYSGNLEFMTPDNSYLVPFERVEVGEGNSPYDPGAHWADPDLDAAAAAMRRVVADREESTARGARAAAEVAAHHGFEARGRRIRERFEEIQRLRASER